MARCASKLERVYISFDFAVLSLPDSVVEFPPPLGRVFWEQSGLRFSVKRSVAKAIFTDSQFWVPIAVLIIGILLLVYVR